MIIDKLLHVDIKAQKYRSIGSDLIVMKDIIDSLLKF